MVNATVERYPELVTSPVWSGTMVSMSNQRSRSSVRGQSANEQQERWEPGQDGVRSAATVGEICLASKQLMGEGL